MSILQEFKQFAVKGNVIDMAVGIIIGASFTSVVKTLVDEVVMPPLGLITGEIDFSNRFFLLKEGKNPAPYETLKQAKEAGATVVGYGQLLNAAISLLLVSAVLFFLVRWMNKLRPEPVAPPVPTTKECPFCRSAIHKDAVRCPACTSELQTNAAA
jgi:large conductance mechanosensitive channel